VDPVTLKIAWVLSGSLAWVWFWGEDAPEFLASAPGARKAIDVGEREAIALPMGVFLALPTLALAYFSPRSAIIAACFAAGAGTSAAMLNFWRQAPAKRTMVLRRHSQSRLVALLELVLTLFWAVACAVSILTGWIGLILLAPAIVILWLSRPRRRLAKQAAPRSCQ
jgi:ABC-2 type transport system permease protein